jgi:hypothetical protein
MNALIVIINVIIAIVVLIFGYLSTIWFLKKEGKSEEPKY